MLSPFFLAFVQCLTMLLGPLFAAVLPVRVTSLTGETVAGELQSISDSDLTVSVGETKRKFSFDALATVEHTEFDEKATGPSMKAALAGGSLIAAQDFSLTSNVLTVEPRRQKPLLIPVKKVRWIRFRPAAVTTDTQWIGIVESERRGDLMVIHRAGEKLDPVLGVVQKVTSKEVDFDLEGTPIKAPLDRLEGLVFHTPDESEGDGEVNVTDIYGSTWRAQKILASDVGKPLRLQLDDSIIHEVPLKHLRSIRWSSGEKLLAGEKPAEAEFEPYLNTNLDKELLNQWFGAIAVGDDLVMTGRSQVEYRAGDDFTMVVGSVRREKVVADAGLVTARVIVDGEVKWEKQVDSSAPYGFQLPLSNARRVKFEVSPGDDGDVGDTVRFVRPRLLK